MTDELAFPLLPAESNRGLDSLRSVPSGLCWWCGTNPATTREHKHKATDLRHLASEAGAVQPKYLFRGGPGFSGPLRSLAKGSAVQWGKVMCKSCNGGRDRLFDEAYEVSLGLRQAEASGLTVDRVDWLKGRTVRIDRQWSTKVKPYVFAPPKSEASIRVIPAAQVILDELSTHVSDRSGFVLQLDGHAVDHNRFGAAWRRAVEKADVQPVRFHDLRHHFASALISAGCSVKAVQRALGHPSASTTLDTYGHMWTGDEDRIREAVQSAFSTPEDSLRTGEAAGT